MSDKENPFPTVRRIQHQMSGEEIFKNHGCICGSRALAAIADIGLGCTECLRVYVDDSKVTPAHLYKFFEKYQFQKKISEKITWDDLLENFKADIKTGHFYQTHAAKGYMDEEGNCEWCRRKWGA